MISRYLYYNQYLVTMGGEGGMLGAIVSLKNNRALLKKRKVRELKDVLYEVSGKTELEFKEVSAYELSVLKAEIRKRARRAAILEIFLYVFAVLGTGLIFYALYLTFW